eukprot:CAMPEP_0173110320 /NCGR_PEP_ID=MMETSP1102-20130122/44227_1 /TAXON_ID=49646 /ORGANISM="Geminigera sp., Strain Caron Lab Isolate" /LENGTH=44 /DNA_ID= /DNA_START= /DNA_END= /DNA_ORIENTATION=
MCSICGQHRHWRDPRGAAAPQPRRGDDEGAHMEYGSLRPPLGEG